MAECCGDGNFCDFPWCDCAGNAAFRKEHHMEKPGDPVQDCGQPCNTCRWTRAAQQAAPGVIETSAEAQQAGNGDERKRQ